MPSQSGGPGHPRQAKGSFLLSDFKLDILICMYKIFWPKLSICDLICHVYILFELVYNILHNKVQIWTFDSDNRIDLLWEFNYVLGFFIQTDLKLDSNSFTKYFQHLGS